MNPDSDSPINIDVALFDLVMALSDAVDLISNMLANHHRRVAYIASRIAEQYGLDAKARRELLVASSMHDIGALTLEERMNTLSFEMSHPWRHAEVGYRFLCHFPLMERVPYIVRYHHAFWKDGEGAEIRGVPVPLESHIIHLADRVDVLLRGDQAVLQQREPVRDKVLANPGSAFHPELLDAFASCSKADAFWLDITSPRIETLLRRRSDLPRIRLNLDRLRGLSRLFAMIIDFRSRFTSTHSSGVARAAREIALLVGLGLERADLIEIAGFLHDLGKLAVPVEILEKKAELTSMEFDIIRSHAYHTHRILELIEGMEVIAGWSAYHHECLGGDGYPFLLNGNELGLEARIISVADVFTAVTEDRPYRTGMNRRETLNVLSTHVR